MVSVDTRNIFGTQIDTHAGKTPIQVKFFFYLKNNPSQSSGVTLTEFTAQIKKIAESNTIDISFLILTPSHFRKLCESEKVW